jgi:hypothetical protein
VKKAMFLATFARLTFVQSKAAFVSLYKIITGDISPRKRCKVKGHAIVIAEISLAMQDFDIV